MKTNATTAPARPDAEVRADADAKETASEGKKDSQREVTENAQ